MGELFVLVDRAHRLGLEIDKAWSLAVACGYRPGAPGKPISLAQVRESAKGWPWRHGDFGGRKRGDRLDVKFSAHIADMVERWMDEVAVGRVFIMSAHRAPWDSENEPAPRWHGRLYTLYTFPPTPGEAMEPWVLFPPRKGT